MPHVSVSIDVPDLAEAARFYCGALGCTNVRDEGNMRVLASGPTEIYLLARAEDSQPLPDADARRSYVRHWTPVHLDFGVDNIETAVQLVLEHGGSVEGTESGNWGAIAYCADPFGHGFCLIDE